MKNSNNKKTIKVLMLVPNLFVANGVASFAMNYLRNSDNNRVQYDFLSYEQGDSPYYKEIEKHGGKVFFAPSVFSIKKHLKECKKILNEGNYDIVHDNTLHISIPMMYCAKKARVKVRILHSHSSKMGETTIKEIRNKVFLPLLKRLSNQYLACSELAGRAMFGRDVFKIVPNVIDTDKYRFDYSRRNKVRKELNCEDKLIVGTVGRLAKQKNPVFALNVIEKLIEEIPQVEYWWIGNGPLEKEFKNYVKSHGLNDYVRFFGKRNEVLDMYQAMDVYFMPSLFEGLPLTGVEAQAMGIPMVVSDTVTREMIYTDLVDYVGLEQSINDWSEHIEKALNRKTDRRKYSGKQMNSVFSNFGCGERLLAIYDNILKNNWNYN